MFEVVKNNLYRDSYMKSLKIESDLYKVIIFYEGDYKTDKENGTCSVDKISLSCKRKDDVFDIMDASDHFIITLPYEPTWFAEDVESVKKALDLTKETITELCQIYKEYFDVEMK